MAAPHRRQPLAVAGAGTAPPSGGAGLQQAPGQQIVFHLHLGPRSMQVLVPSQATYHAAMTQDNMPASSAHADLSQALPHSLPAPRALVQGAPASATGAAAASAMGPATADSAAPLLSILPGAQAPRSVGSADAAGPSTCTAQEPMLSMLQAVAATPGAASMVHSASHSPPQGASMCQTATSLLPAGGGTAASLGARGLVEADAAAAALSQAMLRPPTPTIVASFLELLEKQGSVALAQASLDSSSGHNTTGYQGSSLGQISLGLGGGGGASSSMNTVLPLAAAYFPSSNHAEDGMKQHGPATLPGAVHAPTDLHGPSVPQQVHAGVNKPSLHRPAWGGPLEEAAAEAGALGGAGLPPDLLALGFSAPAATAGEDEEPPRHQESGEWASQLLVLSKLLALCLWLMLHMVQLQRNQPQRNGCEPRGVFKQVFIKNCSVSGSLTLITGVCLDSLLLPMHMQMWSCWMLCSRCSKRPSRRQGSFHPLAMRACQPSLECSGRGKDEDVISSNYTAIETRDLSQIWRQQDPIKHHTPQQTSMCQHAWEHLAGPWSDFQLPFKLSFLGYLQRLGLDRVGWGGVVSRKREAGEARMKLGQGSGILFSGTELGQEAVCLRS